MADLLVHKEMAKSKKKNKKMADDDAESFEG